MPVGSSDCLRNPERSEVAATRVAQLLKNKCFQLCPHTSELVKWGMNERRVVEWD